MFARVVEASLLHHSIFVYIRLADDSLLSLGLRRVRWFFFLR